MIEDVFGRDEMKRARATFSLNTSLKRNWSGDRVAAIRERYVADEAGARVSVLLDMEDYRRLLAELEELEGLRAYDAAKAAEDESIPFEQAVAEIERQRR